MGTCDPMETVCHDGSACLSVLRGPTGAACYLGGPTAIGQRCTSHLDCARTGRCIQDTLSGQTQCFVGCNLDGTHGCSNGASCLATTGNTAGFCGGPGI